MVPDSLSPVYAIIVAGGSGRRCPGLRTKQFQEVNGIPVYLWSVIAFAETPGIDGIILVGPAGDAAGRATMTAAVRPFTRVLAVAAGGASRTASVAAGLAALQDQDIRLDRARILVHDGARPLVGTELIARVAAATGEQQVAIPVLRPAETVKQLAGDRIAATLDRQQIGLAQTPQGVPLNLLARALKEWHNAGEPPVTDEGALIEWLPEERRPGVKIVAVNGDEKNLKITHPGDLKRAALLLAEGNNRPSGMTIRALAGQHPETGTTPLRVATGFGFDVHAFAANRKLILGGIEIPGHPGLAGHSDADVLIHALVDAILGAIGGGDIGRLFPDHDPAYKNLCSLRFLETAAALARKRGFTITAADITVIAQSPKLAPHFPAMTKKLQAALAGHPCRLNLKATTTEGLGFTGRREGIAASAVVTVTAV